MVGVAAAPAAGVDGGRRRVGKSIYLIASASIHTYRRMWAWGSLGHKRGRERPGWGNLPLPSVPPPPPPPHATATVELHSGTSTATLCILPPHFSWAEVGSVAGVATGASRLEGSPMSPAPPPTPSLTDTPTTTSVAEWAATRCQRATAR